MLMKNIVVSLLVLTALCSIAGAFVGLPEARAECCYDGTFTWYGSGVVQLPGNYGDACDELIVTGPCYFETYQYHC